LLHEFANPDKPLMLKLTAAEKFPDVFRKTENVPGVPALVGFWVGCASMPKSITSSRTLAVRVNEPEEEATVSK
jgi:hypothetical protein